MPTKEQRELVAILRDGGVIVAATETLLGLIADASNDTAVERVAEIKGRPEGQPFGLIAPDMKAVEEVVTDIPETARVLMEDHWPGPLTIIFPAKDSLSPWLTQDGGVAIRIPPPCPALELAKGLGRCVTATSANLSGQPTPALIADLDPTIRERVNAVVEQDAPGSEPSTIVSFDSDGTLRVLREGAILIAP